MALRGGMNLPALACCTTVLSVWKCIKYHASGSGCCPCGSHGCTVYCCSITHVKKSVVSSPLTASATSYESCTDGEERNFRHWEHEAETGKEGPRCTGAEEAAETQGMESNDGNSYLFIWSSHLRGLDLFSSALTEPSVAHAREETLLEWILPCVGKAVWRHSV